MLLQKPYPLYCTRPGLSHLIDIFNYLILNNAKSGAPRLLGEQTEHTRRHLERHVFGYFVAATLDAVSDPLGGSFAE